MRATRQIAVILTLCSLCIVRKSVASLPSRCDAVRTSYAWGICLECSLNALQGLQVCPANYNQVTAGQGIRRCSFRLHFGADFGHIFVPGCQHVCARRVMQKECCNGFWGSDCQACPGLPACSGQGVCSDKVKGNGTCTCKAGFKGFGCELCRDPKKFGLYCNETCTCVHGQCDSGVNGTGHCTPNSCHLGYTGKDCNISLPKCPGVHQCQANASCFKVNNTDTCLCEPGFKNSSNSCIAINPCRDNTDHCHNHADCHYLGPGRHNCTCAVGYRGDGIVCEAIDPCQKDNGGCPSNSTVCNYLSPGKSTCSCLPGFQNVTGSNGCSVINLCENNGGCDTNANCTMEGPGMKRCLCNDGYRGNGTVCYGNILQRVNELNLHGPSGLKGELSTAIDLLSRSLARPLSGAGPFTLFLMVNKAFSNLTQDELNQLLTSTDMAWHFVSRHIIASDLDSFLLKKYKTLTTLQGISVTVVEHQNVTYVNLDGQLRKATVVFSDLLAGNGIIHVIDQIMWQLGDFQNTSFKLSSQVFQERPEFSMFASLLLVSGVASEISELDGQFTFLAPTNSAFEKIDNVTFNYLAATDMGKEKMKSLLRNHIFSGKVAVTDLIYWNKVTSLEGESLVVQLTSRGQIVLDENAHVTESNIVTSDGMIHVTDTLLIPDDIKPLLNNFCKKPVYNRGVCYRCDAIDVMRNKGCQEGYKPFSSKVACRYIISRGGVPLGIFNGCLIPRCKAEVSVCCEGFFGAPCHPCPGPFYNPCYGNGKCSDGMKGDGTCHCKPSFNGTACEQCVDDNKFGPLCNQTCTCVNGKCDNRPGSNGTCARDSCLTGFHGMNCDQRDVQCGSPTNLRCHVMARCVREDNVDRCKCNAGYEGSGVHCYEINPCLKPDRGGCHHEATCTKTGPGTNNCSCDDGFRGDGIVCVPVDPCQEQGRGYCPSNAVCRYKGPGQSDCVCSPGYTVDGSSCVEINPCLVNNGGCAQNARCIRNGPGNHTCLCNLGFIGNGYFCFGSISTVISRINHKLEALLRKGNMWHLLSNPTKNLTVLAPSVTALSQLSDNDTRYWTKTTDRLAHLMKNHIINETYTDVELKNKTSLTMLNDLPLAVTVQGNKVLIGGRAKIVEANIAAANGLVHVIDKVLLPPRLPPGDELPLTSELLRNRTEFFEFYNLLKGSSLLQTLDDCQACTIFAPNSSAVKELFLLKNKTLSSDTLQYHVVKNYLSEEAIHNGQEFSTLLGQNYLLKVTIPSEGKLEVNGIDVSIKGQKARRAVVYGLNGVLQPIKNHCDKIASTYGYSTCTSCTFFTPTCPTGWTRIGIRLNSCWILALFPLFRGCHAVCRKDVITKKCCSGFWGEDCQACPGNLTVPCSGQGECGDGKAGNGHCACQSNFTGTACERCSSYRYGASCEKKCDTCVNGTCNEGKDGDGKCLCYHGWKGRYCNTSANFSNCLPTICSHHATCYGPAGAGTCQCDAGYTGNGTHCAEINVCVDNNGGCDENANCMANIKLPRFRSCQCKDGFSGDGLYCFVLDPCQRNNGGCHENATCANIAPGKRNCFCKEGFSGDGISHCFGVNPCDVDNGGCSDRADCKQTAPHERQCTCKSDYVGDGITCIGDIMEALSFDPELTEVDKLVKQFGLDKLLTSNGFSNLLAPVNNALEKLQSTRRKRRSLESQSGQLEVLLKYHILSCVRITNDTFLGSDSTNFTTLLGSTVTVKREGDEVSFLDSYGNVSKVVRVYESSNGLIMKLDSVLTPPIRGSEPQGSFIEVASKLGYTEFVKMVQLTGLTNLLRAPITRPALMFWPTNSAINRLPQDLRNRLLDPANLADLVHVVEYHVVVQIASGFGTESFLRTGAGMELRTLEGASLFVACRGGKGELYVNADNRIIARDIAFDGGVAFGVDTVLVPLEFGGNCDEISETQLKGQCSNCFLPATCPQETSHVGTTNHGCVYDVNLFGCQPICLQRIKVQRCCTNFYGPKCLVCPGGIQSPCSGRGNCIDGLQGSGQCVCVSPFNGTACEMCTENSDLCTAPTASCQNNNGGCHVFATCSETADNHVNCTCMAGYHGDGYYCEMTDLCATNNGGCPNNSTCHFTGPGTRNCLCDAGFYPVSETCRAHHPSTRCRQNHGGCAVHADCFDIGSGVICRCRSGFTGDGYECRSHIVQVVSETRDAVEFNKVLYQLSAVSSEGLSLFNDLQNNSEVFTVFVPVNSAVNHKKFTLHVMKNHILRGQLQLTSLKGQISVKTLAGTDLLVKKLGNGQVVINGVAHVIGDIRATNGLIHMIDQMIPVIAPPPSSTVTPTKPKSTDISTTARTSTGQGQQTFVVVTTSPTTPSSSAISPGPRATTQENNPVGKGAVVGIILGTILCVLLIAAVYWFLKKRRFPSGAFHKKEAATVQFSNEAFNDNSMMSFSSPLYDNYEDPVLLPPLDFPTDDKRPIPNQGAEHLDFENPLYDEMQDVDIREDNVNGAPAAPEKNQFKLDDRFVCGQEDTC